MGAAAIPTVDPDIASRIEALLDASDAEAAAEAPAAPPAAARPTVAKAPVVAEEDDEEPAAVEAEAEAAEEAPAEEPAAEERGIETWDDLASSFEVEPQQLLDHIRIRGRGDEEVSLGHILHEYRRGPDRNVEAEMRAKQAEEARQAEHDRTIAELHEHTRDLIERVKQDRKVNWEELRRTDLAEYVRLKEEAEGRERAAMRAVELSERERKRLEGEEAERREAWRKQQVELTFKLRPEWKDAKVADAAMAEVDAYMREVGFPEPVIESIEDALSIQTVWEAAQYRKLRKAQPEVNKRLRGLPKKALRPSARDETAPQVAERKERSRRLGTFRNSGRIEDGLSFFKELL